MMYAIFHGYVLNIAAWWHYVIVMRLMTTFTFFSCQTMFVIFLNLHNCFSIYSKTNRKCQTQGLVKGAILCFRNPYFYFWHGESTSTASQLTSPASQKSKDLTRPCLEASKKYQPSNLKMPIGKHLWRILTLILYLTQNRTFIQ